MGPTGEGTPPGGWVGDGWVPYGLPQLPLVVQLALQAARALLRGVRLLLQAPDLPPHRLQRAAPRHRAGRRRAGCSRRDRLLRSCRRCRTHGRRAAPPSPRRTTAAPPAAQDRPGSHSLTAGAGEPQAGARARVAGGAGRAPRTPGICKRREALRMLVAASLAGVGCALWGTWRTAPCRKGGHQAGIFLRLPAPFPRSSSPGVTGLAAKGDGAAYWRRERRSRVPNSQAQKGGKLNEGFGA